MIKLTDVTFSYQNNAPVLRHVNMRIDEGEMALVIGGTGSGKSTLLRSLNGLVPHFTGGTLSGDVAVHGRSTRSHRPRDLADSVGFVHQDSLAGFVTDTVEEELAYTMECLGVPSHVMRRRVEETLDLLGLAALRDAPLLTLSGGERQRVAIGAALTAHPGILVLDEPTSALDPGAAEEVLAALHRLVHDLSMTVVLAEHRLERVLQYADSIVEIHDDGSITHGPPAQVMQTAGLAPPVVHVSRTLGWRPPAITIRDARRMATPIRGELTELAWKPEPAAVTVSGRNVACLSTVTVRYRPRMTTRHAAPQAASQVTRDEVALKDVTLNLISGQIVALMGRNGAGKTTLLQTLVGTIEPESGHVNLDGDDPRHLRGTALLTRVGFVPQQPNDLLEADTVDAECQAADRDANRPVGTTAALLADLGPGIEMHSHPRDLSVGEQLLLALAIMVVARPLLLCLDEPTRGLDYQTKDHLVQVLRGLASDGVAIVLATHDVELVAALADRVVLLADGEIVADSDTRTVVTSSPIFAPQVAKIMAPHSVLTVEELSRVESLEHARPGR